MKTTDAITELLELQEQIAELEERADAAKQLLIRRLGVGGSIETDEALVTIVQNTTFTVDFDQLCEVKPWWAARHVTKRVLDQAKFTKLRQAEVLPPEVAEIVTEKPSAPYVKITKR